MLCLACRWIDKDRKFGQVRPLSAAGVAFQKAHLLQNPPALPINLTVTKDDGVRSVAV